MVSIAETFPALQMEHLRVLAEIAVTDRDALAAVMNGLYPDMQVGLSQGVTAAQVLRGRYEIFAANLARESKNPWVQFRRGNSLAYTLIVDGVPMRVQPDVAEIREELEAETAALKLLGMRQTQTTMFPSDPRMTGVLRLEIAQKQKAHVTSVSLYFLSEQTGEIFDVLQIYDGATRSYFGTAPHGSAPQDVDLSKQFIIPAANDAKAKGGDK